MSTNGQLSGWIVVTKPYLLASSLPVLVLFLSELLSDDRQHANDMAERETKRATKQVTNAEKVTFVTGDLSKLDKANDNKLSKLSKLAERRDKVLSLVTDGVTPETIARQLEVSPRTIKRDILALNGQLKKEIA